MRKIVFSYAAFLVFFFALISCDGESTTKNESIDETSFYSRDDLPVCDSAEESRLVNVEDEQKNYVCIHSEWKEVVSLAVSEYECLLKPVGDDFVVVCGGDSLGIVSHGQLGDKGLSGTQGDDGLPGDSGAAGLSGMGCKVQSISDSNTIIVCGVDTVSVPNANINQSAVVESFSLSGFSQKGPFIKGAKVYAYELSDGKTLMQTGKTFVGSIENDRGEFNVAGVNLESQFVILKAVGFFRNEVTGKISKSQISLKALTDVSDRSTANVNLLTHLEYDRVNNLIQRQGMGIKKAKKKAEGEVLAPFFIDGSDFGYSEDINVLDTGASSGALLAMSILLQSDLSEGELVDRITRFSQDIAVDGIFDDTLMLVQMADWAMSSDTLNQFPSYRKKMESWNLGTVPDFERFVRAYWNKIYGIGGCTLLMQGDVKKGSNEFADDVRQKLAYICDGGHWRAASVLDQDTSHWGLGFSGEVRQGQVYDTAYYHFDGVNNVWRVASPFERDLYDFEKNAPITDEDCKKDGSLIRGAVSGKNYVCEADTFRLTTVMEDSVGYGCTSYNSGMVYRGAKETDYFCRNLTHAKWHVTNDTVLDARNGIIYATIRRYSSKWMAEDLFYIKGVPRSEYICRGQFCDVATWNAGTTYQTYYGLDYYTWAGLMNVDPDYNKASALDYVTKKHQGICMDGWHVPTVDDFETLEENGSCLWNSSNCGMSFAPNGYSEDGTTYEQYGSYSYLWTATEDPEDPNNAMCLLTKKGYYGSTIESCPKNWFLSVRCMKDLEE